MLPACHAAEIHNPANQFTLNQRDTKNSRATAALRQATRCSCRSRRRVRMPPSRQQQGGKVAGRQADNHNANQAGNQSSIDHRALTRVTEPRGPGTSNNAASLPVQHPTKSSSQTTRHRREAPTQSGQPPWSRHSLFKHTGTIGSGMANPMRNRPPGRNNIVQPQPKPTRISANTTYGVGARRRYPFVRRTRTNPYYQISYRAQIDHSGCGRSDEPIGVADRSNTVTSCTEQTSN